MASSFNFNWRAVRDLGLRTMVLPAFFALMLSFFYPLRESQQSFFTRNGLILSAITATSFLSAAITAITCKFFLPNNLPGEHSRLAHHFQFEGNRGTQKFVSGLTRL